MSWLKDQEILSLFDFASNNDNAEHNVNISGFQTVLVRGDNW